MSPERVVSTMGKHLTRATMRAAAVAAGVTAVLTVATAGVLGIRGQTVIESWIDAPADERVVKVAAILLGYAVLGALTGVVLARPLLTRVLAPVDELVGRAHRLSEGQARIPPLDSGVDELDRVGLSISRTAQQVARSLAAERDFSSDASHQLRTPLTALVMRLDEIAETDDLTVVRQETTVAIAQVERLTKVVDELLMRSRRTAERAPIPAVSVDSVIAALQREWQPAFEAARRSVQVSGERGLWVYAAPVALSQILSTLLENSLTHARGTVQVNARRSGPSVVIEVTDQGDGVPPTIAPHVFERAVSVGTGRSSGLGLALARDLAEANGGRLDLIAPVPATFALFLSEAEPT